PAVPVVPAPPPPVVPPRPAAPPVLPPVPPRPPVPVAPPPPEPPKPPLPVAPPAPPAPPVPVVAPQSIVPDPTSALPSMQVGPAPVPFVYVTWIVACVESIDITENVSPPAGSENDAPALVSPS